MWGTLRDGAVLVNLPLPSCPSHHQLHKKGMARPALSLPVSPVTVCPLLTLCLLSPPCGCRAFSLSVCYLSAHLPACIVIRWALPVNAPSVHLAGFSATCHAALPVLFLLSVCPRPAADTAFNSLCPSPFNFLVGGRGRGRHRVGHPLISYKLFLANDP